MEFLAFGIAIYQHREENSLIAIGDWSAHCRAAPSRNYHDRVANVHGRGQLHAQAHALSDRTTKCFFTVLFQNTSVMLQIGNKRMQLCFLYQLAETKPIVQFTVRFAFSVFLFSWSRDNCEHVIKLTLLFDSNKIVREFWNLSYISILISWKQKRIEPCNVLYFQSRMHCSKFFWNLRCISSREQSEVYLWSIHREAGKDLLIERNSRKDPLKK